MSDLPEPESPHPEQRPHREAPAGSFTRSLLGAFARGTGLVVLALLIGIVLLQWSDTSTGAAPGGAPRHSAAPSAPSETAATATAAPTGPRTPGELAVLVLNGSGRDQQAGPMTDRLKAVGYRTLTPGNASRRAGSVVLCQPGLDREASALVAAAGIPAGTGALDEAAAAGMEGAVGAACVVIIGER